MSRTQPQISVVLGVRNAATTLAPSLESVLAESELALECIVVDDGSDDETPRLLAEFAARDPRVRIVTAAHWAETYEIALEKLRPLVERGLCELELKSFPAAAGNR